MGGIMYEATISYHEWERMKATIEKLSKRVEVLEAALESVAPHTWTSTLTLDSVRSIVEKE